MTDYDVLFYEEQERRKKEEVAPHILHKKVNELQEEIRELRETLKQETSNFVDALEQVRLRREETEEAEQILGKALGYPPYPICNGFDHRETPAVKTDEPNSDWVCVGDNTLLSLCDEIVDYINSLVETIGEERGKSGLLVAKVKRLEREADWLTEKLSRWVDDCPKGKDKSYCKDTPFCVECWREAARKAVNSSTSH